MSELKLKVTGIGIRTDLNMIYTLSKCIVTIVEMEDDSDLVADTLMKLSESLVLTATELHDHIVNSYRQ